MRPKWLSANGLRYVKEIYDSIETPSFRAKCRAHAWDYFFYLIELL